ncbi:MAG TPA: MBL fold metallo-hydrolase [Ktedonosporobacter sp.]|nr:MBL fold metallo-hydrolase [Ktedonosporobacter sp.]
MPTSEGVFEVPEISGDERVRVFRRTLAATDTFDGVEADAYVVITDRYVIVCDTLFCPEDMAVVMDEVRHELTGRQLLVINSHADWDHAWGNNYFSAFTPIIGHDFTRIRLLSEEAQGQLQDYQRRSPLFQNVVLTPPTITFSRALTLYGGDLTLKLLKAPGHTSDHIAIWLPESRLVLAFDAAEYPLPLLESARSVQMMLSTLQRFLLLQPERILCSHGKTTSITTVQANLDYLREIERRCRTFLADHHPSSTDLEQAALLINYPFDEVVGDIHEPIDREFYAAAHEENVRYIMGWAMH